MFIIKSLLYILLGLLIATIIKNLFFYEDMKPQPFQIDCHPIMIPTGNSFYFEYPCTNPEIVEKG